MISATTVFFTRSYDKNRLFSGWKWYHVTCMAASISNIFTILVVTFILKNNNDGLENIMLHVIPFMGQMFEIIWMSKVAICNRHILAIAVPFTIIYMLVLMIYTRLTSPLYKGLTFKGATGLIVPILYVLSMCFIAKCLEVFRRKMLQWQGHHRIFKIIDGQPT